jgi:hypothetical protein
MTDETELLRRLIEDEVAYQLIRRQDNQPLDPAYIGQRVAEEVLRRLERMGAQVVKLHALGPRGEDD